MKTVKDKESTLLCFIFLFLNGCRGKYQETRPDPMTPPMVRDAEGNIKRHRNSGMMQRWLASVLLHCEKRFSRVKGYASIPEVIRQIEAAEESAITIKKAA